MSDSLRIFTTHRIEVNSTLLSGEVTGVVRYLLNQPDSFELDLRFLIGINISDDLHPAGMVGQVVEARHVGSGVMFTYGLDIDWALESLQPRCEFCVTEISR